MVDTRTDYSADAVAAARAVMLELVRLLGEFRDEIVIVWGWVPELLLPLARPAYRQYRCRSGVGPSADHRGRLPDDPRAPPAPHVRRSGFRMGFLRTTTLLDRPSWASLLRSVPARFPQSKGFCLTSLPLTRHQFSPRPTGSRGEDTLWALSEMESFPRVTSSQRKGHIPRRERYLGGCRPHGLGDRRICCDESSEERDENHGDPPLAGSPPARRACALSWRTALRSGLSGRQIVTRGPEAGAGARVIPHLPQWFRFGLGGRDFLPEDAERVFARLAAVAETGEVEPVCEYLGVRA